MNDKYHSDNFQESLSEIFALAAKLPEPDRERMISAASKMNDAFRAAIEDKQALQKQALTDVLTGLPNRAGIMHDLRGRLEGVKRYGDKDVALAFIDLDGFKAVNDHLGHDVGDEALIRVSERLNAGLRSTDTVGRPGGDELLLIMSYENDEVFDPETVKHLIRNLLKGLVFWKGAEPYPIGGSIGCALLDRNESCEGSLDEVANTLIKQADEDMYADKEGKKERLARARAEAVFDTPLAERRGPSDFTRLG